MMNLCDYIYDDYEVLVDISIFVKYVCEVDDLMFFEMMGKKGDVIFMYFLMFYFVSKNVFCKVCMFSFKVFGGFFDDYVEC